MQPAIARMKAKLDEETGCFEELLAAVETERDILLSGGHDRLAGLSEKKLSICRKLVQVQKERQELSRMLMAGSAPPAKLIELTGRLPQNERTGFKAAVRALAGLSDKVGRLNELNRVYVRDALDTVEHLMGILTKGRDSDTYSPRGEKKQKHQERPRFLAREV